ncbi:MAG: patatin family protein, partial [Ignavibacteriales bacterium]|nr:patatin family protein [Ignavibacteriales bacterium]
FIKTLELQGSVYVIRPREVLKAGRVERDKNLLNLVYQQGYKDAQSNYKELSSFLR